jgi:benzoyl-CoA reductase/2-hydroxyglutaryl-CoA dehydratase subunit BcrC/BadD/HgdB
LALIHAAGFSPYRVLPGEADEDQAGLLLHDNLCPHVKKILDRAMGKSLPELHGMVFMNSCDAMRRLYDAWKAARPDVKSVLVDLPVTVNPRSAAFFSDELKRLASVLESWRGISPDETRISESMELYNGIAVKFDKLRERVKNGSLENASVVLQEAYRMASCESPENTMDDLDTILAQPSSAKGKDGVPVFLFGNMLPDPAAFSLFESCGARVIAEDMCTGSRLFSGMDAPVDNGDIYLSLAENILNREPCARTYKDEDPGSLARAIASKAASTKARGVIGYTAKFCDPYIARLPGIREALKNEGIPFIFLEGDLTMRSMGQHRTRIEAFIEMVR